jgi:hypothetical protein
VQRPQGPRLVEEEEGVVAAGQDRRHVVAEALGLRIVDDADGTVAPLFEQGGVVPGLLEEEQAVAKPIGLRRPVEDVLQLFVRAAGRAIVSIGASHSDPAMTVPSYEPNPTRTTSASPWASRTS